MKTQINDTYIDLSKVLAIGPLEGNRNNNPRFGSDQPQYGCVLYLPHGLNPWIAVVPDVLNNSIDTTHNDAIKAKAKTAYNDFVAAWKALP